MKLLDYFRGINVRELNETVVLHKVVIAPPSDTVVELWGKIVPFLDLPYWTNQHCGFVISVPAGFNNDSMEWYFEYMGMNYYWKQVVKLPGKQLMFVEGVVPMP